MKHAMLLIALATVTCWPGPPARGQSGYRAGVSEAPPMLSGRDDNGGQQPAGTIHLDGRASGQPPPRDAYPPVLHFPRPPAPAPRSDGPGGRSAESVGRAPTTPTPLDVSLADPPGPLPPWQPPVPWWSGPFFSGAGPGSKGMEGTSQFLRNGVPGWKGESGATGRAVGRASAGLASGAGKYIGRLGWFDPIVSGVRAAGAAAGGDGEGAAQEGINWLGSTLAAMAGARAGGLAGVGLGLHTGNPYILLAGGALGTLGGAMAGAFGYEFTGKQIVDYIADRMAAQRGMENVVAAMNRCRAQIAKARSALEAGNREDATQSAYQAMVGLRDLVTPAMMSVGRGHESLALEQAAIEILVRAKQLPKQPGPSPEESRARQLAQEREAQQKTAVEEAEAALLIGRDLFGKKQYREASSVVVRGLQNASHLQAAGRGGLLSDLQGLYRQIAAALEEADRPRVTILSGEGPWTDPSGWRKGTVGVTIDLAHQTFRGSLNASRTTQYGSISYQGTFTGTYTGNEDGGTLEGSGNLQMRTAKSTSNYPYRVTGQMQNYIVTGQGSNSGDSFPFQVVVRQVR